MRANAKIAAPKLVAALPGEAAVARVVEPDGRLERCLHVSGNSRSRADSSGY